MAIIEQIKIFTDSAIFDLQKQVNKFLNTMESTDIVDIKYSHYIEDVIQEDGYVKYRNMITHTAMVIYADWKDKEEDESL